MNDFNKSFDRVIGHEGGFQDKRSDKGNWTSGKIGVGILKGTKFGISAMSYPDLDIKNLTVDHAKSIYKVDWWDKMQMGRYPSALTFQMFDAAIHHGMTGANKILQRSVGVKDDGKIWKITLEALNSIELNDLLMKFLAERINYLTKREDFPTFGAGWMNRIANNLRIATTDN